MRIIYLLFSFLLVGCAATSAPKPDDFTHPLNQEQLIQLVSGNSMIGTTCHSHALYELYFSPNGQLDFYKNHDHKQYYQGKWWVTGNIIHSQWPHYAKKPSENQVSYYHVIQNVYIPYNLNEACGPKGSFGQAFFIVKGDVLTSTYQK